MSLRRARRRSNPVLSRFWIASRSLSSTAHSRDPLARNDGLFVLPLRLTLLDEGADAFLGVARHHVLGHHLGGITIGVGKAHFGLTVERCLAELDGVGGFERDFLGQRNRSVPFGAGGNDAVDEANLLRGSG